jgi:hypothetical protein
MGAVSIVILYITGMVMSFALGVNVADKLDEWFIRRRKR